MKIIDDCKNALILGGTFADEVWLWMPPLAKQQMLLECIPNENKRLRSRSTSTAKYSVKRARSRVASNGSELKSKWQAWWSSLIIHLIKSSNDDYGGPFIIVSSINCLEKSLPFHNLLEARGIRLNLPKAAHNYFKYVYQLYKIKLNWTILNIRFNSLPLISSCKNWGEISET